MHCSRTQQQVTLACALPPPHKHAVRQLEVGVKLLGGQLVVGEGIWRAQPLRCRQPCKSPCNGELERLVGGRQHTHTDC